MQTSTETDDRALKDAEAAIEALDNAHARVTRTFHWPDAGGNRHPVSFVQETLGFFPAQEFMTMMTRIVKDIIGGKYEVDVMELLRDRERLQAASMPSELTNDAVEETITQWKPYIQAFLKLADIVPGLQQDIIALSLGVRRKSRDEFKEMITMSPAHGGLTIDEGVDILKVFIRQNVSVIRRFLGQQVQEIGQEFMKMMEEIRTEAEASTTGGMQSSTTPPATPEPA